MSDYNKIIFTGNLGRDPEMRYTPSGTPVTNLNVASNRAYKNAEGELVKETTWFRVSVFGKGAENAAQYLHKGSKVLVEGLLRIDATTGGPRLYDKKDGGRGASFEVMANIITYLSSKGDGGSNGEAEEVPGAPTTSEDTPF